MFTGLVQAVGRAVHARRRGESLRLSIRAPGWRHRPRPGDSICVNGVCLTLARRSSTRAGTLEFDAVSETLQRTTLGGLIPGSPVNLEHAATPLTFLGGHIVQGHVDGVCTVARVQPGTDYRVWFTLPPRPRLPDPDLAQYIVPKGSVCIDGVSLTIAGLWAKGFHVALIPTTIKQTTLGLLRPGDRVNLEADLIAKTVVHWLTRFGPTTDRRKRKAKSEKRK